MRRARLPVLHSTRFPLSESLARNLVPVDGVEVPKPESPALPDTGARLATALLAYMGLITAVVTLLPFQFAYPSEPRVMLAGGLMDMLANVALFIPLGFLYAVARNESNVSLKRVVAVAVLVSATIETVQLFEVTRFASLSDIIANGLGAWLGAAGQRRLARRIAMDARTVGRLALELPLMGLVYLLLPLLWVDGLAGRGSVASLWPMLALGLFGASLLGSAQRHHFGPNRSLSRELMTGAACVWFLLGAFPGLAPRASIVLFLMVAAVGVFVWVRSEDRSRARSINRRFESKALSEAAPFYAAYLLLLVAPVAAYSSTGWRGELGFGIAPDAWNSTAVLHVLETVVAFTLLGYMLAELRGRREARFRQGVRYIAACSAGAAALTELLEGLRPDGGASALRMALLIVAALYGAWLYHLQRAHVRRLLGRA